MAKKIELKEFQEKGYLQELNRRFLHLLGLALSFKSDVDGEIHFDGILDYRENGPIYFGLKEETNIDRIKTFHEKYKHVESELNKHSTQRQRELGFIRERIPKLKD